MPRQPKAEATIQIFTNIETAQALITALKPEIESPTSERSVVGVSQNEEGITLKIVADDLPALRAAINSYLHWIQGIIEIGKTINN